MHDVAARAGVSQRTVSNVVRGYVHVLPETRARVQRAIDELGYRPHANAVALREGKTGIIGLAVPYIAAAYFAELADLIQQEAAARQMTLLFDQTGADRERELLVLDGYRRHVIDGLILSPMAMTAADLESQPAGLPTVLLGERIRHSSLISVAIDNVAAAREAVGHLLAGGRRRVAAVGADLRTNEMGAAEGRLEGYLLAHADAGVRPLPALQIPTGGWVRTAGYAAVDALLNSGQAPDALFCFNDMLALGAIRALLDHHLRVPEDVAVVGWDDVEEGRYSSPSLSTVSPDKAAIARAAVGRLLDQIGGAVSVGEEVLCGHQFIVRESSSF